MPPEATNLESATDPLSRSVVHLACSRRYRDRDGEWKTRELGIGTGFIRRVEGHHYLVTALHVLTRCDEDLCQPNLIHIKGYRTDFKVPLYRGENDPNEDNPWYWQHPNGPSLDVGILPLPDDKEVSCTLEERYFDPQQNAQLPGAHVSQSCVIIGFPDGLIDTTHPTLPMPVWRTGRERLANPT
jgi:hypothetical protein